MSTSTNLPSNDSSSAKQLKQELVTVSVSGLAVVWCYIYCSLPCYQPPIAISIPKPKVFEVNEASKNGVSIATEII